MIAFWHKLQQRLLLALLALLALPIVILFAYHLAYLGKVYPKVTSAGVDLSNKSLPSAEVLLQEVTTQAFLHQPAITLAYEGNEWNILKANIQFSYNTHDTAQAAFLVGRNGKVGPDLVAKWQAWFSEVEIPIGYSFNEKLLEDRIASIAAELGVPPIPPSLEVLDKPDSNGLRVQVHEGESGHRLQVDVLRKMITDRLLSVSDEPIVLPVETVVVDISPEDVKATSQRTEKLVKRKLSLVTDEQNWSVSGQDLINLVSFKGGFDVEKISSYVDSLATSIDRAPQNAAFQYVDGKVREFRPAKDGLRLQRAVVVKDMLEALAKLEVGEDEIVNVNLAMERAEPDITLAEVNNLGIKELLGRGTSTYKGSIAGRVYNVGLSAERINGALVPPGETFSFNAAVGEISGATGYQPAYVIRSGATVLDDGGGVCQTSSTLFRAALYAGLPIVERKAHSYRVGYYEQNAKAGLDATVFAPTADLKFLNDTPGHILIQTNANSATKTLVIEIYGSSDGRSAEITNQRVWDVVPAPPPRYQDDPSLGFGQVKQVDWAAAGAKAKFDYIVRRNGEVIINKTFLSVYRPWQAVYLRGTGG